MHFFLCINNKPTFLLDVVFLYFTAVLTGSAVDFDNQFNYTDDFLGLSQDPRGAGQIRTAAPKSQHKVHIDR